MIIKFEVNGAWQIFDDIDSLMYRKLNPHEVDLGLTEEAVDFTETIRAECSREEGNPGRVLLTFMNSKQLANSEVVAFSPIYLMNNEGRTVETI